MTYKEFRKATPLPPFMSWPFIDSLCCRLSPILSILFIKKGIKPNTITLLMIVSGIIGGIVLMLPHTCCKFFAGVIYLLWYVLDCSDGEVARFTSTFSKGGKYLDWCAHLTAHPLFALAMWYSLISINDYFLITTVVSFVFIISELLGRNRISMDTLYGTIENTPFFSFEKMGIIRYFYSFFVYLPNMIVLLPFVFGFSIMMSIQVFYWLYIGWAVLYSVAMLRVFAIFVFRMYKSE